MLSRRAALRTPALLLTGAAALSATGCSAPGPASRSDEEGADTLLRAHGLEEMDAREIIDHLDQMPVSQRPADLMASVEPQRLVLSAPDGESVAMALPPEEFYLSVAPFREHTHECHFHSLTTCRGELRAQPVQLVVEDANGRRVLSEDRSTYDNGFVGMWLPRGLNGSLRITHEGLRGSETLNAGAQRPTCLTTLRLT